MYAFIEANANQESRIPRKQLAEVAQVNLSTSAICPSLAL
jgi:hypothetical protein